MLASLGATVLLLAASAAAPPRALGADRVYPGAAWAQATPGQVGMDPGLLARAVEHAEGWGGAGMVTRHGRQVAAWGDTAAVHDIKSATKSFGSVLLGIAIDRGLTALADRARPGLPELGLPPESNEATGWLPDISVQNLATHTAGFEAEDPGFVPLVYKPGKEWLYSNGGVNWLADYLTAAFGRDLKGVLVPEVTRVIGIPDGQLRWRANGSRPGTLHGLRRRELASGIGTSADGLARFALLVARRGEWNGRRVVSAAYLEEAGRPPKALKRARVRDPAGYPEATGHYGLLFWNNADGVVDGCPEDATWAWGIGEEIALAVPSLDLAVGRVGPQAPHQRFGDIGALEPFFAPLCEAAGAAAARG